MLRNNNELSQWRLSERLDLSIGRLLRPSGRRVLEVLLPSIGCRASVPCDTFPKKYVRGLPPYDLPLILLARLAVDRRFAGRGPGHALISEALRISLRVADEVGCRSIITDAYRDRVSWYARYGFVPIEGAAATGPQKMFLDLRTVRAALQR